MILDLREFQDFPAEVTLSAKSGAISPFSDEVSLVGDLRLEIAIQECDEEFFCQGKLTGSYMIECARCLRQYEQTLEQKMSFIARAEFSDDKRDPHVPDDEEYVFFKGGKMQADLTESVQQALVLSLLLKPVCTENCRGLCPKCGVNLNDTTCNCKTESIDPRWEGLKDLSGGGM